LDLQLAIRFWTAAKRTEDCNQKTGARQRIHHEIT